MEPNQVNLEIVDSQFVNQALAFPDSVDRALSTIASATEAKDMLDRGMTMKHYAERLRAGIEVERPIAFGVLKIKAKLGELMPRESGGRGKKTPIPDIGVSNPATIAAYRKIADHQDRLEEYYNEIDDVPTQSGFIKHCHPDRHAIYTGEESWYTPVPWIEMAREVMGTIDLDPASSEFANRTVGATRYFTVDDNGLEQEWHGTVWLNPPFSQPKVTQFTQKLCDEYQAGRVTQAVSLYNNNTETTYFQLSGSVATAISMPNKRINFFNEVGPSNGNNQGQTFFYFGENVEAFQSTFEAAGLVYVR